MIDYMAGGSKIYFCQFTITQRFLSRNFANCNLDKLNTWPDSDGQTSLY